MIFKSSINPKISSRENEEIIVLSGLQKLAFHRMVLGFEIVPIWINMVYPYPMENEFF